MGLIDIHTHLAPRTLPVDPGSVQPWPCMHCKAANSATLMLGDKPFRDLDDRSWDAARRCEDMDRDGIAIQFVSPMPELLSYWQEAAHAEYLADHVNAAIAELVSRAPSRFRGFGMVPLQDAACAARYAEGLRARFGLIGVEIGSNINGMLPGDAQIDPFLTVAEEQGLAIFVHALHPLSTSAIKNEGAYFGATVGFPLDTAMAGASLIMSGALQRHPRLRIALSHGGGALSALVGRLDQAWRMLPDIANRLSLAPSAQAATLFYDSNVYDPHLLRHIATSFAPGQVCAGSDYPYLIMQEDLAGFVATAIRDPRLAATIGRDAAIRFGGATISNA